MLRSSSPARSCSRYSSTMYKLPLRTLSVRNASLPSSSSSSSCTDRQVRFRHNCTWRSPQGTAPLFRSGPKRQEKILVSTDHNSSSTKQKIQSLRCVFQLISSRKGRPPNRFQTFRECGKIRATCRHQISFTPCALAFSIEITSSCENGYTGRGRFV